MEEVGQRILTALKQKIGPSWVLYNLAGLYWRIMGNSYHGVECIRRALYFAPDEYRDVPLVNLANILYKWGRLDDAILVVREALDINALEVYHSAATCLIVTPRVKCDVTCLFVLQSDTHFLLANLLSANNNNMSGAAYHYEESLFQDPLHRSAMNGLRVIAVHIPSLHTPHCVSRINTKRKVCIFLQCHVKFHRLSQSSAVKLETCSNKQSCSGVATQGDRVVCLDVSHTSKHNQNPKHTRGAPGTVRKTPF